MLIKSNKAMVTSVLVMTGVLLIGTLFSGMIMLGESGSTGEYETIVLAYTDDDEEVGESSEHWDSIDDYGRNILIETTESGLEELKTRYEVKDLEYRNKLTGRGYEFDTNRGLPELHDDLKIDDYESGTEGIYIVDLMGPVNPEWREKLEDQGVEIINYVPNYAYEVVMTPEQAERVEELFFVEWVGIYQPGFKLAEDLEPGLVSVRFSDGERSIMAIDEEDRLIELANRNDVYYVNQYYEPKLHDEMATQTVGGGLWIWDPEDDPDSAYRGHGDYGSLATQMGHDGEGIVVAVADTGIGDGTKYDAGHPDFDGRVIGGYDYGSGSYDEGEWADGHGHGTHVAGSIAGHTHGGTEEKVYEDYYAAEGTAPGSELFAVKVFDDSGNWIGGDDYREVVEIPKQAEDNTYVHTNSWGSETNGEYTDSDEDFDRSVRDANRSSDENEPMVIVVAAGNEGPDANSIGSPGNAKNVITVGSTGNYPYSDPEAVSKFSSRGWTDDYRVKPDVMAPGEDIYSTEPGGGYVYEQGTSMATPAVAGAAASVVDWYEGKYGTKPNPSMVRALLINTAYDLANEQEEMGENSPYIPNQDEGWGMVNLPNIVHTDVNMSLVNEDKLIETGEVHEYAIEQDDDSEPLRISLTWTDAVPLLGVDGTLNNDLNLEVESPSGQIYRGNNLVESWSVPGEDTYDAFDTNDDGWDDVNNVENIYLLPEDVEEGTYTVRVIGKDVPLDANNDGGANQDYSLVKWNALGSELALSSPSDPDPADGATGIPTDVELSVYVEHEEEESMEVLFYNASNDSLIGEDKEVKSGERASVVWEGLEYGTEYDWYAVADDGTRTAFSDIWSFTTEGKNYTLTIDSTAGGEVVKPGEDTFEYEEGKVVELRAVADEGYHFIGWTGDVGAIADTTANRTTIEMLDDHTITAEFEIDTYTLDVSSTEGGYVVEPGEETYEYDHGTNVYLEVVSDDGYNFVQWTGEVGTVEDTGSGSTSIEMLENYTITAEFEEEPPEKYDLTIKIIGEGSSDPEEGIHTYEEGEVVDIEARADEGWYFVNWTGDATGTETIINVTVDEDKTITAHFEKEDDGNIPGLSSTHVFFGMVVAVAIFYYKKE